MMSLAAQGAYINLLAIAWDSILSPRSPTSPDRFGSWLTAMPEEWKVIKDEVWKTLSPFDEDRPA